MLVAVIVLFAVCWGPSLIDNVLVAYGWVEQLNYGYLKHMRQAFALMSYFNSCVNPCVYAFMSRNFRQTFQYAICSCIKGRDYTRNYRYQRQAVSSSGSTNMSSFSTTSDSQSNRLRTSQSKSSNVTLSPSSSATVDFKL